MDNFSHFETEEPRLRDEHYFIRKTNETKNLRKLSFLAGTAVLLYVLIQNAILVFLELAGKLDLYINDNTFSAGIDILLTVLGVFVPFCLAGRQMKKISGEGEPVMADPPRKGFVSLFGTLACTGCIMLANILSSYITYFISLIGYELESPDIAMPDGLSGFLLTMLRICLLAAVVEEYCLRGHIMGNLRQYGDMFAIVMAASVFALMHGTLVQVPFAMLSGIALGYFAIKTGSIWPAVAAHAINNGLSVVASYLIKAIGEEGGMLLYSYAMYVLIFVGLVSFFLFALSTKDSPLRKSQSILRPYQKLYNFLFTPTTFMAFLVMVYITSKSIS